jgi:hypothetical protein
MMQIYMAIDPTLRNLSKVMLYGDTDSCHVHVDAFLKGVVAEGLSGEDIGQMNNDLGGKIQTLTQPHFGDNALVLSSVAVGKKLYCEVYADKEGVIKVHKRGKGIPTEKLTMDDYLKLLENQPVETSRQSFKKCFRVRPSEVRVGREMFSVYSETLERVVGKTPYLERYELPQSTSSRKRMTLPWGHEDVPADAPRLDEYLERVYKKKPTVPEV